jgi:hypothetical protein
LFRYNIKIYVEFKKKKGMKSEMPSWGIHLYIAKKVNEKLKINDYNSFLIGNIIPDINNGHLVPNVSKIIGHRKTHYNLDGKLIKNGKKIFYDIEGFVNENKENLQNPIVIGYISHLLTDEYWNSLVYTNYAIQDENGELIGLKLNNGEALIGDGELRRKTKVDDFRIYAKYLYTHNLVDIPIYTEKAYELSKVIKNIELTKSDIQQSVEELNKIKNGFELERENYKILSQKEMQENTEKCTNEIINFLENLNRG